jgi:hypothetical protein
MQTPETLYVSLLNFPPACKTVITTSRALRFFGHDTGRIPRHHPYAYAVILMYSCGYILQ